MRFACVEYTTKTGQIWRHTPERPNYLCDPEKEIDPTSFGCYTSALNGEHLPLTGLIYGSLERSPSKIRSVRQDLFRRAAGSFRPYDLAYLRRFDVLLVIYQISNDDELVRFTERLRRTLPHTLVVSCSSPPFGRLREHWKDHPETAERYRAFVGATHFNMNVCRATVPWYRAFTGTPSLYLPQPYPVEYAIEQGTGNREPGTERDPGRASKDQLVVGPPAPDGSRGGVDRPSGHGAPSNRRGASEDDHRSERGTLGRANGDLETRRRTGGQPIVYVAGDTVRPDIMSGHLVAKVLQRRHPELLIRVTKTPEFPLNTAFLAGTRFEVVPFRPWAEQLQELATVCLVINTDLWWTRGRVPVDCAAAGVPCVGTTSDGQSELWPDLAAADSAQTDQLVALADRCLFDQSFREAVVAKARRRLTSYTYQETVKRFRRAVELARQGRLSAWRDPVWEGDTLAPSSAP